MRSLPAAVGRHRGGCRDAWRGEEEALRRALVLIERSGVAMVGSNGPDGYPLIKAMLVTETDGARTVWFSTNTSSARRRQFAADPRASVYFVDQTDYEGLMLVGDMEVLQDQESRDRLWREGWEMYYPQGRTDPDYSVLRFTTRWANYYQGLQNTTFTP